MRFGIYEDYEFCFGISNIDKKFSLNHKVGELLVFILNNQKETENMLNNLIVELKKRTMQETYTNLLPFQLFLSYSSKNVYSLILGTLINNTYLNFFNKLKDEREHLINDNINARRVIEYLKKNPSELREENEISFWEKKVAKNQKNLNKKYSTISINQQSIQFLQELLHTIQDYIFYFTNPNNQVENYNFNLPSQQILRVEKKKNSLYIHNTKNTATNSKNIHYIVFYNIENLYDLFNIYKKFSIDKKLIIKQCKNCKKYFIPHNKQAYCDNFSPQNPQYTCKTLPYDMRNNIDSIYLAYRKSYKTQHNKLSRQLKVGNINEQELKKRFYKWNEAAKQQEQICKNDSEYVKWYNHHKDWIKIYK